MVKPGQVWENGVTVVKIQKSYEDKVLAVTFEKEQKGMLHFSHTNTVDEMEALDYVLSLGCILTDKILAISL